MNVGQFSARNKDHQWQRYVMKTYRQNAALPAGSAQAAQLRQDAEDYLLLLRSTRRHEVHFTQLARPIERSAP